MNTKQFVLGRQPNACSKTTVVFFLRASCSHPSIFQDYTLPSQLIVKLNVEDKRGKELNESMHGKLPVCVNMLSVLHL